MSDRESPINLGDFETAAISQLSRMVYDYYAGGAGDEVLLSSTRAAWNAISLRYKVLRDVSHRSLACTVLGQKLDWPMLVAPMAFQQLAHPDGEIGVARAAAATGTGMVLSTLATTSIEEVRAATTGPLWFQLYIYRDREASRALVQRAESAGCDALVLTVDSPMLGRRERDIRNAFHVPAGTPVPNLSGSPRDTLAAHARTASSLAAFVAEHWDASISWRDLEWLQSITKLPILVKGIVRGDDARMAMDAGAAGVIVSNHGGRQLDTAIPTARALPEVADAMGGSGALLVDGGVRRGTDVVKALALGAHAVLLGRPVLWGLAVDGAAGAERVLRLLRDECDLALGLSGCRTPMELGRDFIA